MKVMTTNKKRFLKLLILIILVCPLVVFADEVVGENFCSEQETQSLMLFLGYIIMFVKYFVPLVIIVKGIFEFYNVVKSGKQEDMKKAGFNVGKRILAGVIIMLLPTLINISLGLIKDWNSDYKSDYDKCTECLFNPTSC